MGLIIEEVDTKMIGQEKGVDMGGVEQRRGKYDQTTLYGILKKPLQTQKNM